LVSWRTQHAYLVADRFDVVETPEDPDKNTVSFYGYVRGTYMDKNNRIHLNGLGDYDIAAITKVEDPCPIEMKRTVKEKQAMHRENKLSGQVKKQRTNRNLKDKEKIIYAPFSNIGTLNFEKSTGYITIPDKQVVYTRVGDEEDEDGNLVKPTDGNVGQQMVWKMQDMDHNIDAEYTMAPQLLDGVDITEEEEEARKKRAQGRRLYPTSANDNMTFKIGEQLDHAQNVKNQFMYREREVDNLHNLIYGNPKGEDEEKNTIDWGTQSAMKYDTNRFDVAAAKLAMYKQDHVKRKLKKRFVTG
jgi:hypothetical protein